MKNIMCQIYATSVYSFVLATTIHHSDSAVVLRYVIGHV